MRLIDKYLFRTILSHALLGLLIFTFVFFVPLLIRLMELVVAHSASWSTLGILFLCTFPGIFTFTIPIGVLVGVLIALGRMSSDSELIAMSALGMGRRRLFVPVGILAVGGTLLTLCMTVWLAPLAVRTTRSLEDEIRAGQASFQVAPRVFDERFPHLILYINDVDAAATRWHGVFLAWTDDKNVSRLTLAEDAIVIADRKEGKLELHLHNGTDHELTYSDPQHYSLSAFSQRDWPIGVMGTQSSIIAEPTLQGRTMGALLAERTQRNRDAAVELQRRFSFPFACIAFAMIALPLGARPRRGGRSGAIIVTLLLITGYYLLFTLGAGFARQGTIPVWLGIWLANVVTAGIGILLLPQIERMPSTGRMVAVVDAISQSKLWNIFRGDERISCASNNGDHPDALSPAKSSPRHIRFLGMAQIFDIYILRNFLFYFVLLTVGFILLFEVFTFFDLLDDIAQHRTGLLAVFNYFRLLACYMFYQLAPLAALVSVLITLGVMAKNNELVALKAAGVSLYRLSLPLLLAGSLLAVCLIALDDTYLPYVNQRQDALRNEIKGRPAQTYYQLNGQWIFGENGKVYNYEFFDPDQQIFGGLNVLELDPATFQVRRRIYAARAHWDNQQKVWILESGWLRDFKDGVLTCYVPFLGNALMELNEPPTYFNREVRQSYQMSWWELKEYIVELSNAGFDVARLSVQLQKKLSFPLIAPIIILLAIPFSIVVGTRGALGGIALGVGIAIVYWAASALTEAMGAVGQLPPFIAGWAPDTIFSFLGLYFFLKMPT